MGPPFGYPVRHGTTTPMYIGNVVPADWPVRADRAAHEAWAKLPSWHIEEAASLVCGYQPRKRSDLPFFPLDSEPKAPPPYEGAKTWNALFHGEIGAVFDLYARFKRTPMSELPNEARYVSPAEFVRFCDECGVDVPAEFRDAVNRRAAADREPETNERKSRYRARALQVARDLKPSGVRVTIDMFQGFIESDLSVEDRVDTRTFQDYLKEWRDHAGGANGLKDLLRQLLRGRGRLSEDEKDALRRSLPGKCAQTLPASGATTKNGK
jgi:hypothetical protein